MIKRRSARLLARFMLLTGLTVLGASGPAAAQPPAGSTAAEVGKKANEDGERLFAAGDYKGALAQFQRVDAIFPDTANPKHKIAVCLDKLGRIDEAIEAYERFIVTGKKNPKFAEKVAQAETRVNELRTGRPGVVTLAVVPSGLEDVTVTVDGNPREGNELELTPGEHVIVVSAAGRSPVTQKVTVEAGGKQVLAVNMTEGGEGGGPATGAGAQAAEEGTGTTEIAGYALLGIGGAAIVVGAIFGGMAMSAESSFNESPNQDDADKQKSSALISDVTLWPGVAAAGVGLILVVVSVAGGGEPEAEPAAEPAAETAMPLLVPYAAPSGAGMAARWVF